MVDGCVQEEVAFQIVDDLMDGDHPVLILVGVDGNGFHVRAKCCELARPVVAHGFSSMDVAAFHSVRPFNLRVHARDYRIDVAGIEITIGVGENFALRHEG